MKILQVHDSLVYLPFKRIICCWFNFGSAAPKARHNWQWNVYFDIHHSFICCFVLCEKCICRNNHESLCWSCQLLVLFLPVLCLALLRCLMKRIQFHVHFNFCFWRWGKKERGTTHTTSQRITGAQAQPLFIPAVCIIYNK